MRLSIKLYAMIFLLLIFMYGSSVNWVKRKCGHKTCCNNENSDRYNKYLYQIIRENGGWENWTMIKLSNFPCNSKFELELEERRYIELLKSDLNKNIPTRTQNEWTTDNKEKLANYRIDNAEKIADVKHNYYIDNKEKFTNNRKNYYIDNKEKINKHCECDCGGIYIFAGSARHIKTLKHQQFIKQFDVVL